MSEPTPRQPLLLKMEGIEKSFPGVRAVRDGRLELRAGECHALMGENGAGKSTLIKILAGAHHADAGRIRLNGEMVTISSPAAARTLGIAVIYQELNLIPTLSARENLFLGRERSRAGFLFSGAERREAAGLFRRIGADIPPDTVCRDLTVAQQQCVEIAKALLEKAQIVVMDEPTAALTGREVENLFTIIRDLKRQGIGVLYVSHRLDEIFAICDRVTVMRDGQYIDSKPIGELDRRKLIELMVGRPLEAEFPARKATIGEVCLDVKGLCRGKVVRDVSFQLRRGEVVGLTGLIGAGRTEVARMIFGADRPDSGDIVLKGKQLHLSSPHGAIDQGICLLTEDRKSQGLVLGLSVRENFGLPNLPMFSHLSFVNRRSEGKAFARYVKAIRIKVPHQEQLAKNLSGGNQQKVVLAKWLQHNADVILIDEPTRGIDVGAKAEIYGLINELAAEGKAVLMISSELPEVLGMSDRILVMSEGRLTGEFRDVASATQQRIMALATPGQTTAQVPS